MNKLFLGLLLIAASGSAHAGAGNDILLRAHGRDYLLGSISTGSDMQKSQVVLRAANGVRYCRDVAFNIRVNETKGARIDFGARKWIYRFAESAGGACEVDNIHGYSLEFSLANETDLSEVDFALEGILEIASAKPVPPNIVVFDSAGILECALQKKKWRFSEIYSEFGKKFDEDGNEIGQRFPSVAFHLVSDKEDCKEAYVVAFFPSGSEKTYLFVTNAAALPL